MPGLAAGVGVEPSRGAGDPLKRSTKRASYGQEPVVAVELVPREDKPVLRERLAAAEPAARSFLPEQPTRAEAERPWNVAALTGGTRRLLPRHLVLGDHLELVVSDAFQQVELVYERSPGVLLRLD